jgi:hypothetical protein
VLKQWGEALIISLHKKQNDQMIAHFHSYYLNMPVAAILKNFLRNLIIITNVNVTCANGQKRHANRIANKRSADFY